MFCVTDFLKVLWAKTARKEKTCKKTIIVCRLVDVQLMFRTPRITHTHKHTSTFILSHSIHTQKDIKFARVVKDYNNTLKKKHKWNRFD